MVAGGRGWMGWGGRRAEIARGLEIDMSAWLY